jgi:hypothetical protein
MSVILHKKYGVNPAIFKCFICGKDAGLILPGAKTSKLKDAGLADEDGKMHQNIGCIDKEPCSKCQKIMRAGIIFISTKDDDQDYRTGGWCAIKEEAVRQIGIEPPELLEGICKQRVCFIQDTVYDQLGFPRNQDINNMEGVN